MKPSTKIDAQYCEAMFEAFCNDFEGFGKTLQDMRRQLDDHEACANLLMARNTEMDELARQVRELRKDCYRLEKDFRFLSDFVIDRVHEVYVKARKAENPEPEESQEAPEVITSNQCRIIRFRA